MSTSIAWTDETWNPLRGCRRISPGCENCYAERQAARPILSGPGLPYEGLVQIGRQGPRWTGETAGPDLLDVPLRWKKPRKVFPCSMSDLFFEGFSFERIAAVFGVMAATPQHTYQVLTKRIERARRFMEWAERAGADVAGPVDLCTIMARNHGSELSDPQATRWPLPNVAREHGVADATARGLGLVFSTTLRAQDHGPTSRGAEHRAERISAQPLNAGAAKSRDHTLPYALSPSLGRLSEARGSDPGHRRSHHDATAWYEWSYVDAQTAASEEAGPQTEAAGRGRAQAEVLRLPVANRPQEAQASGDRAEHGRRCARQQGRRAAAGEGRRTAGARAENPRSAVRKGLARLHLPPLWGNLPQNYRTYRFPLAVVLSTLIQGVPGCGHRAAVFGEGGNGWASNQAGHERAKPLPVARPSGASVEKPNRLATLRPPSKGERIAAYDRAQGTTASPSGMAGGAS